MRISDWSSDVCSSDLCYMSRQKKFKGSSMTDWTLIAGGRCSGQPWRIGIAGLAFKNQQAFSLSDEDWGYLNELDRESVVQGKSVSVRVDHGGRRFIKKKKQ